MRSAIQILVMGTLALSCGPTAGAGSARQWQEFMLLARVRSKVTAYCPCRVCCGVHANGRTAIGRDAGGRGAAVDPQAVPYGSILRVPQAGYVETDDTGGAMRRSWRREGILHIDLRMRTHAEARRWGVRWLEVAIYRPARKPR